MDSLIEDVDKKLKKACSEIPAVSLAVTNGDEVVFSRAFGKTSSGALVDVETTAFMVASISKTLLAMCCLQCAERGELSLESDINNYLPSNLKVLHPTSAKITALHLLQHNSGLRDDESALHPGVWRTEGRDCEVSLSTYIKQRLCPAEKFTWREDSRPGRAPYHYSNLGFALLGFVIECATKRVLSELCTARIFDPLQMQRSRFFLAEMLQLKDTELAIPHRGKAAIGHYGVAEYPAAQLRSTTGDLARYLRFFSSCAQDSGNESPLLSQDSLNLLFPKDYMNGLAWWGRDAPYSREGLSALGGKIGRDHRVWQHGGMMDGVRTHIFYWPPTQTGLVVLTNSDGYGLYRNIIPALVPLLENLMEKK